MDYNKYPEEVKRQHPSLCFQCAKAVKPAALALANEGFTGCRGHMDRIRDHRFSDARQEDLAAEMLHEGIQCQKAATGWSSAIPLDNDTKPWRTYNGILLIKGCTECPHFEPKSKA